MALSTIFSILEEFFAKIGVSDNDVSDFLRSRNATQIISLARDINSLPAIKMARLRVSPVALTRAKSIEEIADSFSYRPGPCGQSYAVGWAGSRASWSALSPRDRKAAKKAKSAKKAGKAKKTLARGIPGIAKPEKSIKRTSKSRGTKWPASGSGTFIPQLQPPISNPPLPQVAKPVPADIEYLVWYGTNRKPIDPKKIGKGYSAERDISVHLGVCKVFVPESHQIGSTGSSWLRRFATGIDDRLKLTAIDEVSAATFWVDIAKHLKALKPGDRDALIFVHGYNVSFEDAAIRAAQIGVDLGVPGAMAFFSWPSKAKIRGYTDDEATIEASENFITQFMVDFAQRSGATRVHIIAHSMGNRGVLRAVNRIAEKAAKRARVPFDQIILAAADVDAGTFRDLCDAYARVSRRTTLYVSSRDRAVEASKWLHDFPRAGLLPPIMVAKGIDTINVTNADLTKLGHGYVAEAREVLTDMHNLLAHGDPPSSRFGLQKRQTDNGDPYWLIGK